MRGYTKGFPAWAGGLKSALRMDTCLNAAAFLKAGTKLPLSGTLESPEIIDEIELVDIP